ncbi:hypothetical protein F5146DRAFT_665325 [Armillaria mellea]|nr:hypothetical protein F5146DRAFT_665325 [Armillaria mellea]
MSLYSEISPPGKRRRQQLRGPLNRPLPVTPPPFLAPPLPRNPYSGSSNTTFPGWNTDSHEELREELYRLRAMVSDSNAPSPSQETTALQGPAHWAPDVDSTHDESILQQTPNAEKSNPSDLCAPAWARSPPLVAAMDVDATPGANFENGVVKDEFEFKVNYDAYNVPMRAPALPLTINKHDVTAGGTVHNPQQQQQPRQQSATPSSLILFGGDTSGRRFKVKHNDRVPTDYSGPWGTPDVSFDTSFLRPSAGRKPRRRAKSIYHQVSTKDSVPIKPPAKKRKRSPVVESEQYPGASVEVGT